ncbi:PREDICTED: putative F-box protein At1g57580 [Camelina sativa]|uniref:F-box protein At1g57580 n=1 Tax=Camelina sativa TaxID=90675 RepID=A0ABM1QFL9_CAMSA|nr:PREDICTED: putative F-box protein At1g57580 [Camelina sativa]
MNPPINLLLGSIPCMIRNRLPRVLGLFINDLSNHTYPRTRILNQNTFLCSGLLLLSVEGVNGVCVANPITKKFRFLNQPKSRCLPCPLPTARRDSLMYIGLAVDQTDRNTQSFKVVCILNGSLHWLRNDGSIFAFNPETEQARLIPTRFPKELSSKTLFAADNKSLTFISATEEVIYVYSLENILTDPKWVLGSRIRNGVLDEKRLIRWNVEAYDGICLVLREETKNDYDNSSARMLHGYDLRTNSWGLMGSIIVWCNAILDFFQFAPSSSYVIGLQE